MYSNAYGSPYSPVSPAYSAASAAAAAAELALATPPGSQPQSPAPLGHQSPLASHHHHLAAAHMATVAAQSVAASSPLGNSNNGGLSPTPGGSPLMHPHHSLDMGLTPPASPLMAHAHLQPTAPVVLPYPLPTMLPTSSPSAVTMAMVHAHAAHAAATSMSSIQSIQQQQIAMVVAQASAAQQAAVQSAQVQAAASAVGLTPQGLAAIQLLPSPAGVNHLSAQLGTAGPERPGICLFVFHLPPEVLYCMRSLTYHTHIIIIHHMA
jgi:hypothetical protein